MFIFKNNYSYFVIFMSSSLSNLIKIYGKVSDIQLFMWHLLKKKSLALCIYVI